MQCPECGSYRIRKNGIKQGKQNHICVECSRQFSEQNDAPRTHLEAVKQHCLVRQWDGLSCH